MTSTSSMEPGVLETMANICGTLHRYVGLESLPHVLLGPTYKGV